MMTLCYLQQQYLRRRTRHLIYLLDFKKKSDLINFIISRDNESLTIMEKGKITEDNIKVLLGDLQSSLQKQGLYINSNDFKVEVAAPSVPTYTVACYDNGEIINTEFFMNEISARESIEKCKIIAPHIEYGLFKGRTEIGKEIFRTAAIVQ